MNIARKQQAKEIKIGNTVVAFEYPLLDLAIHGSVIKIFGRYPEKGRVVNEKCAEIGFVLSGSGKIVIEGVETFFEEGDQILIKPGESYYWEANATMFVPCAPAWYPEQHKEVDI